MRRNETTLDPEIRPFSNNTEYEIWYESNCDQCVKAATDTRQGICKFDLFVSIEGEIRQSEAMKYGYNPFTGLMQNCTRKLTSWPKRPKTKDENQLALF